MIPCRRPGILCCYTWHKACYDSHGTAGFECQRDNNTAIVFRGYPIFGDVVTRDRKSSEGAYSVYDEVEVRTRIVFDIHDNPPLHFPRLRNELQLGDYLCLVNCDNLNPEGESDPVTSKSCDQVKQREVLGGVIVGNDCEDQVTLWL